jgi:hypothetical protein
LKVNFLWSARPERGARKSRAMFIPELQQESIKHITPSTDKSRTFNECNRLFELDDQNEIELLL